MGKTVEKPKRGAGRPKAKIDWRKVGVMLESGATAGGIAASFGITEDTLYNRCRSDLNQDFSAFRQQKLAKGDDILRTEQFKLARAGNVAMLIWLGKNRLGQTDKQEMVKLNDLRLVELKGKIEIRAKEKGIPYEKELANFLATFAADIQVDVKEKLASELEM